MDGDKRSGELKRKLSWELEMEMETGSSQKSQQNSSKAGRRLNHFERVAEQYADRHRVQFHNFLNKKVTKFEHRTSLRKLIDVNKNLQESQIKCIELMGFGTLAKIQLDQLDKVMLRWLLDRYDPEYSCFNIETHCYFVGDKDVEGALGVPATSQNIILDTTCIEGLKKYENIFKVVDGRIDMATLSDKLKSCTSTDTEFKVMYLALLFGTVLFPSYTQNLPVHYLNPLAVVDCINDLNWAGLIRNTLNDGIKRWKNKEGTYMSGCLLFLQVFFLAIIRPENSRSVINLASERPFLAFLTKPRIRSLTTDMQINVPYWSAKASYFGFDEMSAPTNSMNKTKVRTIRPDVSGDGSIDEHEENVMDSNVSPDDCVHDENVRDSNVSLDDFVHDENVLDSNVSPDDWVHEDLPSDQHRSLNKNDEVEDPHVKQQTQNMQGDFYLRTELSMLRARVSRIEKQTDYVCKDDELRNPHMTQQTLNAHDDFYRNQLSLLSARVSRIEKQTDYVCDDFGSRCQISLLSARVNSSEKQVAQLMNIVDELVTRHVNRDRSGNRTNSQEESVDKIDSVLQKLQNLEAKIPLIIRSTLGGINHRANIAPNSSTVNIPGLVTVDDSMLKKKREKSVLDINIPGHDAVDEMLKKKEREVFYVDGKERQICTSHL